MQGETWVTQLTGGQFAFKGITFLNEQTGFATGSDNIRRTTNGGMNWDSLSFGRSTETRALYFNNVSTGYVVGNASQILKTTDMGNSWILQSAPYSRYYRSVYFLNDNTGYAVGDSYKIIKTTNRGNTWDSLSSGRYTNNFLNTYSLRTVYFTDANNGYSMGDSIFLKTTNGGTNWSDLPSTDSRWFLSMCFLDQSTGYLGDELGSILKTTNGGLAWIQKSSPDTITYYIHSIFFPTASTGYAMRGINPGAKILKTTDSGENWLEISNSSLNHFVAQLFFTDENTGYATMDFLKKTTDGGQSWDAQTTGISTVHSVYFVNDIEGFVAGNNGGISKTLNAGNEWKLQSTGASDNLLSIYFLNSNTGFVSGDSGIILKTTNSGEDWIHQNSGIFSPVTSIKFSTESKGHACSADGKVLYTSDGGDTWNLQYSDDTYLSTVQFPTEDIGYIAVNGGYILKTTTGGVLTGFTTFQNIIPEKYYLSQNYPNPFNPNTIISYKLQAVDFVKLKVYDVLGNEVVTLVNEKQNAGTYSVEFNGSNLASGIYFYKIDAGSFVETRRMILLK